MHLSDRRVLLFGIEFPAQQWLLLVLCSLLAMTLGFVSIDPETAKWCVQNLGYWQMLLMVGLATSFFIRYLRFRRSLYLRWWRINSGRRVATTLLIIFAASGFAHIHFPHRFKVLGDEAVLLNTSAAMHQHRLVYTPGSAEYRNGIFFWSDGYIDKRPYLFPFLVSVVHDFTGYRPTNPFWVNALLTPGIFAFLFLIGRNIHRKYGGGVAVLFGAGVPVISHVLTGAGFEGLNLFLLLAVIYLALCCVRRPTSTLINLFALSVCLLAYCRYESAMYVCPAVLVIAFALNRARLESVPWILFVAPLLLVPIPWLQLIAFANESLYFQLAVHDDPSAFSLTYLPRNLQSAWTFFLVPNPVYLSSPLITIFGLMGLGAMLWRRTAVRRRSAVGMVGAINVLFLFGFATAANALVFLLFNYGQYSEYITQRISIPVFAILALGCAGCLLTQLRSMGRWLVLVGGLNLVWFYMPAANGDFSFREYIYSKDADFVQEFVRQMHGEEGVFVYTHSAAVWLANKVPCMDSRRANSDSDSIYKVLKSGQYNRILIHTYRYTENVKIDKKERQLPPSWFNKIEKRLVAKRWVAHGIFVEIYEFSGPGSVIKRENDL